MEELRQRTISISRLQQTFAKLKSDEACVVELKLLAQTGHGSVQQVQFEWVNESASKLRDFMLLMRLRKWLPALLDLRRVLAGDAEPGAAGKASSFFSKPVEDDVFFTRIEALCKQHAQVWDQQTLNSVSALVAPVKELIGTSFTALQLDFLALLAESKRLVHWLLEHSSQTEFNQLLQVCRPNTDEPRLLSSIGASPPRGEARADWLTRVCVRACPRAQRAWCRSERCCFSASTPRRRTRTS